MVRFQPFQYKQGHKPFLQKRHREPGLSRLYDYELSMDLGECVKRSSGRVHFRAKEACRLGKGNGFVPKIHIRRSESRRHTQVPASSPHVLINEDPGTNAFRGHHRSLGVTPAGVGLENVMAQASGNLVGPDQAQSEGTTNELLRRTAWPHATAG